LYHQIKLLRTKLNYSAMDTREILSLLGKIPAFAMLSPSDLAIVAAHAYQKRVNRYQFLFMPDEPAKEIYILVQGKVKIGTFSNEGREVIKEIASPTTILGYLSLVGNKKHNEYAQVLHEEARLVAIPTADLMTVIERNPSIMFAMMSYLTQRLQHMEERLTHMIVKDARERIIEFLLDSATKDGRKVGFEVLVKHHLTQQDIANITGTSRQTVTSVFNDLKKSNQINFSRNSILIRDVAKLA
jgi:CRP/FNR family transcriptional regulator, cyclic AMP receptor protein